MDVQNHQGVRKRVGLFDRGAITLSYTALIPDASKGTLIILHGVNDHKGRYLSLQEKLAKAGFANYAYDQRGFGISGGRRTDIARYQDYLYDLKAVVAFTRKAHPNQPIIIIGHSLGGTVAATFCIDFPQEADGLVLSAPAYDVPRLPLYLESAACLLNLLLPTWSIRYASPSGTRSRDPAVDRAVQEDPLITTKGTPRFYIQFRKMNHHLRQHAERITVPTLILQGSADTTIRPEGARTLYKRLKNPRKKLIWYEGFYHEVFHEIGRDRVIADVTAWLESVAAEIG